MDSLGIEHACFKGRIPVNVLVNILAQLGIEYNTALIAPESVGVGEAVIAGLQEKGYPNLYYTEEIVKEHRGAEPIVKKKPGFHTGVHNRSIIINLLEQDIREYVDGIGTCEVKDPFFISEAYTFVYDDLNRPVAMSKGEYIGDGSETYTDDAIMAKAITNFIRKRSYSNMEVVTPK